MKNKLTVMEILFIVFLIFCGAQCCAQEFIDPYYVWFDYPTKRTLKVQYTLKGYREPMERRGSFHASKGSNFVNDYKGTGYDRGHLFPASYSRDARQMYNSFDMKNVVPMEPSLNRGIWNAIEGRVGRLSEACDSIQVTVECLGVREKLAALVVPQYFKKTVRGWKNFQVVVFEVYFVENVKPVQHDIRYYILVKN